MQVQNTNADMGGIQEKPQTVINYDTDQNNSNSVFDKSVYDTGFDNGQMQDTLETLVTNKEKNDIPEAKMPQEPEFQNQAAEDFLESLNNFHENRDDTMPKLN